MARSESTLAIDNRELVLTQVIDAQPEQLFRAWAEPNLPLVG